jgi:hypothetical protein
MAEKLDLPFPLLSDPRGDLIKRCGLWNEEEGVSEPVIVALDGSGTVRYLCSGGTNFADRPRGESLLYSLDRVVATASTKGASQRSGSLLKWRRTRPYARASRP